MRRVAAGESLLDPALTERVLRRLREGPEEEPLLATLTHQERRILDLIAEGKTNRQIAEDMFLAEKTVKNYVSNLLTKLGMERTDPGRVVRHPAQRAVRARPPGRLHRAPESPTPRRARRDRSGGLSGRIDRRRSPGRSTPSWRERLLEPRPALFGYVESARCRTGMPRLRASRTSAAS